MYEYISGKVVEKNLEYVAIDISGLAYLIYIPFKTYEKIEGEDVKLYIYQKVKEDDIRLYGFYTKLEREVFIKIISVSGIGPKIALSILSSFTTQEILSIINANDHKMLSSVPGLGVKKAQKLIIELKDKFDDIEVDNNLFESKIIKNELKLALSSLGYANVDIDKYISDSEIQEINDSGKLMKLILKKIGNKIK
ncbi:Holliday junction branch migration protein RuvA [Oceanivirga miroungae]|uniref:Holliday junction branch migration complex subunit RuvA n=1 Tax=Oceanivirga miroungae TaxID=1130046 RepID=A0A6I8MBC4_9FUSO|nr:Holliday junction branch migration protein RuvA [Oceanivirga miroungae]VWL85500.1 Holliday junction DNA helicase RuvA [Oceanivirga miroungae]